ncbi:MAG: thiamine pyrophosphate-dependent enzyme [Betaproteobacteria bacterium]
MTGGQVLIRTLRAAGVDRIFCVPGESFLGALDACYDEPSIDVVCCRHESGAGLMAVADARLTGKPGICLVSRGPGASNAVLAVHVAQQDAVPLILIIGQVERANLGRGAFQEVDYVKTFSDMAKWTVEVHDPARLSELIARAFHEATAGTPGPVVISVPEDVLEAHTESAIVSPNRARPLPPAPGDIEAFVRLLEGSQRPIVLAGGDCEPRATRAALQAFSEAWAVPVAATNKRQAVFPNAHDHWVGHIGFIVPAPLARVLAESALIIALGTRLGDVSTQRYRFPQAPTPAQPLIHVYPDAEVPGRNHRTELAIVASAETVLAALADHPSRALGRRQPWIARLRAVRDELATYEPADLPDGLDFGRVALALNSRLADDAIVTLDAGNFVSWIHAHIRFRPTQDLLGAVGGSMGLAVPAAVAASLRFPQRQVVALVGDGGFLMTGAELATAMAAGATPKIFIANNGSYGVIRAHQEAAYPGRVVATDLTNPDFAALARSFGAKGLTLAHPSEVDAVVEEALHTNGPVIVDVKTSLERINAFRRLSDMRAR